MASLTSNIDTVNQGKAIIAPERPAPSLFSSLSKLGQGVFEGVMDKRDAAERARRQAADDARAARAEGRAIVDQDMQVQRFQRDKTLWSREDARYAEEELGKQADDDLASALADPNFLNVEKLQTGVAQGRVNPASASLQIATIRDTLYNKYPTRRSEISAKLKELGYQDAIVQSYTAEIKARETAAAFETSREEDAIKAADSAGIVMESREKQIAAGFQVRAAQKQLDAAEARSRIAKTNMDISKEERDQAEKDATDGFVQGFTGLAFQSFQPFVNRLTTMVQGAERNPAMMAELEKLPTLMNQTIQMAKTAAIGKAQSRGANGEAITRISAYFDDLEEGLVSAYTGPLSRIQASRRAMDTITTEFNLRAEQTMPAWTAMTRMFGVGTINQLFAVEGGVGTQLDPKLKEQIKREFSGYNPMAKDSGMATMSRIAQLLDGDIPASALSEAESRKAFPVLVSAFKGIDVAEGPQEMRRFQNAATPLLTAAVRLQPGLPDLKPVDNATALLLDTRAVQSYENMIATPGFETEGRALLFGARGAAAHLLNVTKSNPANFRRDTLFQRVELGKDGKYSVVFDEGKYNNAVRAAMKNVNAKTGLPNSGIILDREKARRRDPTLDRTARLLNFQTGFLVRTAKHDDEVPGGLTERQLRLHYADPARHPFPRKEGQGPQGARMMREQIEDFRGDLTRATENFITSDATNTQVKGGVHPIAKQGVSYLQQRGLPEGAALAAMSRVNFVENSTFDVGNRNEAGDGQGAEGFFQWRGARLTNLRGRMGEKWTRPEGQFEAFLHELDNPDSEATRKAAKILKTPGLPDSEYARAMSMFERAEGYNPGTGRDNFTDRTVSGMQKIRNG